MSDLHRPLVEKIYGMLSAGDLDRIGECFTEDYVEHQVMPGSTATGLDALREAVTAWHATFADMNFRILDLVTEGNTTCVRYQMTGTHTGEFMGMPATGKQVMYDGVDVGVVAADGRCCEHWGYGDDLGLLMQLGMIPEQAAPIDLTEPAAART